MELKKIPLFSPVTIRIYLKGDRPEKLEIRESGIFSWYD